jgi:hypothetical protein
VLFFFSVTFLPDVGLWPPLNGASRSHSLELPHSVGLLWTSYQPDLYLTTHNIHERQTSMPLAGFEPTVPASERPQTHSLDHANTGIASTLLLESIRNYSPPNLRCPILAKNEYFTTHDRVGAHSHSVCKALYIETTEKWRARTKTHPHTCTQGSILMCVYVTVLRNQ